MRPHRLRVTAFGAFAATEQVTFDDLEGLFLLHGETGAGKTTLLDAIAFALYGQVPGERGTARRLRSDHASPGTATEVELEATIGGRRLRVTRKPEQARQKRSGTGVTTEPASVRLAELSPSGDWESKSTRIGEVDAEIENLMGMSAAQFFQVVLLPQGEFAKFLRAGAKDKEALLQKLFSTDRFRKVEDWLADRRRATEKEAAAAQEGVTRLVAQIAQAAGCPFPDDVSVPSEWATSLSAQALASQSAAAALVGARKADLDARLADQRQAEQFADRQRRRRDALRRQRELQTAAPEIEQLRAEADAAARAAEISAILDALDLAEASARSALAVEAAARNAAQDAADASLRCAPAAALRTAAEAQRARLGRLDALRTVAEQAAEEDETAATARGRAAGIADELASAEAQAALRRSARPSAQDARDAASRAAAALLPARAAADLARRVADDSAALVREHARHRDRYVAHLAAREEHLQAQAEALRIRGARIDGMRAELAAAMTDGSPCPVCGSLEHPDPVDSVSFPPVTKDGEDAAFTLAGEAAGVADKLGKQVAASDAVIGDLTRRLTSAGFAVPDPASALPAAVCAAEAEADRLEAEASRLGSAAACLTGLQGELDALDKAIAADTAKITELTEQRAATLAEAEAAARRAGARRAELRAHLGDAADLGTAIDAATRLTEALTSAADAADETARAGAEADATRQRAVRAATDRGFGPAADAGTTGAHDALTLDAVRASFRQGAWRAGADDQIARHHAESQAVADLLADPDLDVNLGPTAQVEEAAEAVNAAQRAHDEANTAYGQARHRSEQLALLRPRLDGSLGALRPLRDRAGQVRHLADLANGISGANQFKMTLSSFVLAARLEEVAAAASERLAAMTAGRYSLVHSDARKGNAKAGLSLLACDAWTGIDRDTATLSGGETFLASLALALGLADVVTAESAGTPMEALFVDEGFGTLDEDTLDEVMNVLDGLRAGGRIVGIVSHVTELRQRIPAQVHVRKSRAGSHVDVIPG